MEGVSVLNFLAGSCQDKPLTSPNLIKKLTN